MLYRVCGSVSACIFLCSGLRYFANTHIHEQPTHQAWIAFAVSLCVFTRILSTHASVEWDYVSILVCNMLLVFGYLCAHAQNNSNPQIEVTMGNNHTQLLGSPNTTFCILELVQKKQTCSAILFEPAQPSVECAPCSEFFRSCKMSLGARKTTSFSHKEVDKSLNLRVFARIRPLNERERNQGDTGAMDHLMLADTAIKVTSTRGGDIGATPRSARPTPRQVNTTTSHISNSRFHGFNHTHTQIYMNSTCTGNV
jgi:hypothetical protein